MKKYFLMLAAYVVIGFLSFGYLVNDSKEEFGYQHAVSSSFFVSIIWPIYWAGRLSINLSDDSEVSK